MSSLLLLLVLVMWTAVVVVVLLELLLLLLPPPLWWLTVLMRMHCLKLLLVASTGPLPHNRQEQTVHTPRVWQYCNTRTCTRVPVDLNFSNEECTSYHW